MATTPDQAGQWLQQMEEGGQRPELPGLGSGSRDIGEPRAGAAESGLCDDDTEGAGGERSGHDQGPPEQPKEAGQREDKDEQEPLRHQWQRREKP